MSTHESGSLSLGKRRVMTASFKSDDDDDLTAPRNTTTHRGEQR